MVALHTPKVDIGWQAADFSLQGVDGKTYGLADVQGPKGLVVMFICNHCPFVKAIQPKLVRDMAALKRLGVHAVAINANDAETYPDDSYEKMQVVAKEQGYMFPYLVDASQEVAKAYDAVCTPDFFGFDKDLKLQYRGRLDDSGMDDKPDAHRDLFEAMAAVAEQGKAPDVQYPSIGCSIKWK